MPLQHFFPLFWKLLALASKELKLPELADLCSYTACQPHAIMGIFSASSKKVTRKTQWEIEEICSGR